jgi:hypothetical protein
MASAVIEPSGSDGLLASTITEGQERLKENRKLLWKILPKYQRVDKDPIIQSLKNHPLHMKENKRVLIIRSED